MQVVLATQTLADWSDPLSAEDLEASGQTQEEDIVRSASKWLTYRGNEIIRFNFTITKQFENLAAAEAFFLTYWTSLTKNGTLVIKSGYASDDPNLVTITSTDAVLERIRMPDPIGVAIRVQFFLAYVNPGTS